MESFLKQIQEDFNDYRELFPNMDNLKKDEWAFNFWILDKLFSIDENIIEAQIVDYNDLGIDCFVWHEDSLDLYLIQNKFYSEGTPLPSNYIANDFLTRPIGALSKGTYTRNQELQKIYSKFCEDPMFKVHFHLYITNDSNTNNEKIKDIIFSFNEANPKFEAKLFGLKEIESLYYNEPIIERKKLDFDFETINKGTILNINNNAYNMTLALDARYVLVPVSNIFKLVQKAQKEGYPLFDENIREYLGSGGNVNKQIYNTLMSPTDRENFFFYNNGITIIVEDMGSSSENTKIQKRTFTITNPQIVNGCQTVSTIAEALSSIHSSKVETDFCNTFVMAKLLKIEENSSPEKRALYENIVRYNNSQNNIKPKLFEALRTEFRRLQLEFERKGFLLLVKQSDKHTFKTNYQTLTELKSRNQQFFDKFNLEQTNKLNDYCVDLEKLLQVIIAFKSTTNDAVQNKSKLLKGGSKQNQCVIDFIKANDITINDIINLYMLYKKADTEKKSNGRFPIPLYLINNFANYDCKHKNTEISKQLDSTVKINRLIQIYKGATKSYHKTWMSQNEGKAYNDMMKSELDRETMGQAVEMAKTMFE